MCVYMLAHNIQIFYGILQAECSAYVTAYYACLPKGDFVILLPVGRVTTIANLRRELEILRTSARKITYD